MGCSSSFSIFESFSTSLEWIICQCVGNVVVLYIFDDFLFIASSFEECSFAFDEFQNFCVEIGVPLASEKTLDPLQAMLFAGIHLDSVDMSTSLPVEKITKLLAYLDELISLKSADVKQVQSVTGMLNCVYSVIESERDYWCISTTSSYQNH